MQRELQMLALVVSFYDDFGRQVSKLACTHINFVADVSTLYNEFHKIT